MENIYWILEENAVQLLAMNVMIKKKVQKRNWNVKSDHLIKEYQRKVAEVDQGKGIVANIVEVEDADPNIVVVEGANLNIVELEGAVPNIVEVYLVNSNILFKFGKLKLVIILTIIFAVWFVTSCKLNHMN